MNEEYFFKFCIEACHILTNISLSVSEPVSAALARKTYTLTPNPGIIIKKIIIITLLESEETEIS